MSSRRKQRSKVQRHKAMKRNGWVWRRGGWWGQFRWQALIVREVK